MSAKSFSNCWKILISSLADFAKVFLISCAMTYDDNSEVRHNYGGFRFVHNGNRRCRGREYGFQNHRITVHALMLLPCDFDTPENIQFFKEVKFGLACIELYYIVCVIANEGANGSVLPQVVELSCHD